MKPSDELLNILDGVTDYAHRGSYGKGVPENSITAFSLATEKGLGLEIDVHLTADNDIAVFHDFSLKRMCGCKQNIEELTIKQIKTYSLKRTDEKIPTLKEVLEKVDGRVPILIELKCLNNEKALCDRLIDTLSDYNGKYLFIGFSEIAAKYLKDKGYLVAFSCFKAKRPSLNFEPDALICFISGVPFSKRKCDTFPPIISWTVTNKLHQRKSKRLCIATIYNTKHFDF